MTEKEILETIGKTVEEHPFTYPMILFSKKNKEISDYIYSHTEKFNEYPDFMKRSRVYCVLNGITDFPRCKVCGTKMLRNIKSKANGLGFPTYCSPRCENTDPDVIRKLNETNMDKYGCRWSFQSDNNKSKTLETMRTRYGVEYAQQNRTIKEKSYETMKSRYGDSFPSRVESIRTKMRTSNRLASYERFLRSDKIVPMFSSEDYIDNGNDVPYEWKCLECGTVFESPVDMSWFKQGQNRTYARCEKCYPRESGSSSGEQDMLAFICQTYGGKVSHNVRCLGNGKHSMEIDILLDDMKIGFEFDGLYYHGEMSGKSRNYHLTKTRMAGDIGIRLIHVFENEWMNKREIVKSRIRNILRKYDSRIYARCCEVVVLSKKDTDEFMDSTHIQGRCASSVNLGLKYDGDLVSVMTFGKSRFNGKYEWELLRFSNSLGCHVPGGAGKLLRHFERNYSPKSLISYADMRWSVGNLYAKLGFTHVGNTKPNYWYVKGDRLMSRMGFQKHKLKKLLKNYDEGKSEVQNMRENGYDRIFDCGNMVFVKEYL